MNATSICHNLNSCLNVRIAMRESVSEAVYEFAWEIGVSSMVLNKIEMSHSIRQEISS